MSIYLQMLNVSIQREESRDEHFPFNRRPSSSNRGIGLPFLGNNPDTRLAKARTFTQEVELK